MLLLIVAIWRMQSTVDKRTQCRLNDGASSALREQVLACPQTHRIPSCFDAAAICPKLSCLTMLSVATPLTLMTSRRRPARVTAQCSALCEYSTCGSRGRSCRIRRQLVLLLIVGVHTRVDSRQSFSTPLHPNVWSVSFLTWNVTKSRIWTHYSCTRCFIHVHLKGSVSP